MCVYKLKNPQYIIPSFVASMLGLAIGDAHLKPAGSSILLSATFFDYNFTNT